MSAIGLRWTDILQGMHYICHFHFCNPPLPSLRKSTVKGMNLLPLSKFIPLRVDPFWKRALSSMEAYRKSQKLSPFGKMAENTEVYLYALIWHKIPSIIYKFGSVYMLIYTDTYEWENPDIFFLNSEQIIIINSAAHATDSVILVMRVWYFSYFYMFILYFEIPDFLLYMYFQFPAPFTYLEVNHTLYLYSFKDIFWHLGSTRVP